MRIIFAQCMQSYSAMLVGTSQNYTTPIGYLNVCYRKVITIIDHNLPKSMSSRKQVQKNRGSHRNQIDNLTANVA